MDDLRESEGVPETLDFLDEGPPGVDAPGVEGFEELREGAEGGVGVSGTRGWDKGRERDRAYLVYCLVEKFFLGFDFLEILDRVKVLEKPVHSNFFTATRRTVANLDICVPIVALNYRCDHCTKTSRDRCLG